ncbi:putative amidohydrolase [Mangrovibacterium marinum]|uniref:Omega-amidase YafV n=1 Tax=Mangrovibacterium marinum TaxID=1639118 RepID=A0A2T5BX62_9BACT|nr:amidohydrolase [Mangrovibacterium marinum]PTN04609.1 putative amidohydrolase [Mangrovibacterium marinum]
MKENEQDRLTLSLIQADLVWEDVPANLKNFEKAFRDVPSELDLLVLPEMFSTGFSMQVEKLAEPMSGPAVRWMTRQAASLKAVVAGSLMIAESGLFYNRFVFAFPNGELLWYDKRHLFSMGRETVFFSPGNQRQIIQIKGFRILPQICYDLRFPVFARNRNDYDLYLNCANWPAPRQEVWDCLLKARAIENQCYVAAVNRVGTDANGIRYSGHSQILDARGRSLHEVAANKAVITARLSLGTLQKFRKKFPVLPDADNFNIEF